MAFKVGDIVHVSGLPIHPKKGKYAVLIYVGPNRFFLVNTENRSDYDCIPLLKKGRSFPRHDSFIGCKNIFQADDSQIDSKCGELDNDELTALAEKVRTSKYIPKVQIDPILVAIRNEISNRARQ